MEENGGGFLSGTRPAPLSEKTSDNDAAQQQIFSIRKHRDGRIMVLMGTDAAKRVVSLRGTSLSAWLYSS
ncbi:hypothetical protein KIN20_025196 [Parelaphostrongylus tenuis]|uniref:Uncharacterized protein n=1 Tax=Parelaphostrongylus tenuis TaxID=148309 RepID=A0AAD5QX66_PARTN|nr:hypothetical protein KIN20_025196 [Parelaphostrongylus tenuis]